MKRLCLALSVLTLCAAPAFASDCPETALGTARTLTLPKAASGYGTAQYPGLALQKGEVVLTFDDGPRAETTPKVLAALKAECVQATFFMMGEAMLAQPDLTKQIVAEGHTAGIHGFQHPHMGQLTPEDQLKDLNAAMAAATTVLGADAAPTYRFPFLEETDTLKAALKSHAYTVFSIDVAIDDWLTDQTPQMLTDRLMARLAEGGGTGGIILLHDWQPVTAEAMPMILAALKAGGYRVVHVQWEK